jgi:2-C-methyl-D-erythritol 4-phosphate cytidylyltransferase
LKAHAVILAAGLSERFQGDKNKVFTSFKGQPLIKYLLNTYINSSIFDTISVLVNIQDRPTLEKLIGVNGNFSNVRIFEGGETRHQSEEKALQYLKEEGVESEDLISIHDAARAFIEIELLSELIDTARLYKSSVPALKSQTIVVNNPNTLYKTSYLMNDLVISKGYPETVIIDSNPVVSNQEMFYVMQTPQTFLAKDLFFSYSKASEEGWEGVDTVECILRYTDTKAKIVEGTDLNMKITFLEDLKTIKRIIKDNDIKI